MKGNSFKGGVHPHGHKEISKDMAIERLKAPKMLIIPLSQHIGAPCNPVVEVGDSVCVGQKIGDTDALVSSPIHSSVSGKVVDIRPYNNSSGTKVNSVIIENDFNDTVYEGVKPYGTLESLSQEDLVKISREAGLVGMGGATFPTHMKLKPGGKVIDYVIINAAECEPYLTPDYRAMLEWPEKIIGGLRLLMKALGVETGYIGVEDNKPDAIKILTEHAEKDEHVKVIPLPAKYPQGGEKQLIFAITGRQVPSGKLPSEVGAAVFNTGTCIAFYNAVTTGMPLVERLVSITGHAIKEPKNLLIKIGTLMDYVINEGCGGFTEEPEKVIAGGPMMGVALFTTDVPVAKGTSGILTLTKEQDQNVEDPHCIRCGKCVESCPMGLVPYYMNLYGSALRIKEAEQQNVLDCIECGACAYSCPGKLNLVQTFRVTKLRIQEERRKAAAANK